MLITSLNFPFIFSASDDDEDTMGEGGRFKVQDAKDTVSVGGDKREKQGRERFGV